MPTHNGAVFADVIRQMIALKLDVIPLQPGTKRPKEHAWGTPVERRFTPVMNRFGENISRKPTIDVIMKIANVGVLNASSNTLTLDRDSDKADKALIAAAKALGGSIRDLATDATWRSVKGIKAMYRRGAEMPPGRVAFKLWNGEAYETIFELRGTGQDVIPPSYRADAKQTLAWIGETPTRLTAPPKWLVQLYHELERGEGAALTAMYKALGADPKQRRTHYAMARYPLYLNRYAEEQAYANAHYDVPELLEQLGYVKEGTRWRPAASKAAPGIVPPRGGHDERWLCEHEGDVLAGVFDAWRVIVEHLYGGDPDTAARAIRFEMRQSIPKGKHPTDEPASREEPGTEPEHEQEPPRSPAVEQPRPEKEKKQSKEPIKAPKPFGLPDGFLVERIERIEPIIGGVITLRPGLHVLSAMPKAGKSTLTTAIALTAVTGKSISNFTVTKPVRTLYCAFDESVDQNLQPRIQRLASYLSLPAGTIAKNLHIIERPDDIVDWIGNC